MATLRRLDRAFIGDDVSRAGGLRKLAELHARDAASRSRYARLRDARTGRHAHRAAGCDQGETALTSPAHGWSIAREALADDRSPFAGSGIALELERGGDDAVDGLCFVRVAPWFIEACSRLSSPNFLLARAWHIV